MWVNRMGRERNPWGGEQFTLVFNDRRVGGDGQSGSRIDCRGSEICRCDRCNSTTGVDAGSRRVHPDAVHHLSPSDHDRLATSVGSFTDVFAG